MITITTRSMGGPPMRPIIPILPLLPMDLPQ